MTCDLSGVSVARARARQELGNITERHLRRLVAAGRLTAIGGPSRRITRESLNSELSRRELTKDSFTPDIPNDSTLNTRTCDSRLAGELQENSHMRSFMPHGSNFNIDPLLSTSAAALAAGVSDATMRMLIQQGIVQSVPIGKRRRVPLARLREFTSGEKQGSSSAKESK